jgi:hypothetical protein
VVFFAVRIQASFHQSGSHDTGIRAHRLNGPSKSPVVVPVPAVVNPATEGFSFATQKVTLTGQQGSSSIPLSGLSLTLRC